MVDTVTKEKRHEIMSKIRAKNTKIEIRVRLWLHHNGVRYRKNCKGIIGNPDIAIKKYKIAIFINGCFWHGHWNCKISHVPKSQSEFWEKKIEKNRARDERIRQELIGSGWNVFVLWECQINANFENVMQELLAKIQLIKKQRRSAG